MEAKTIVKIDARNPGLIPKIFATQYDSGRKVRCYIAGVIGNASRARIYCKKPSGKETYTDGAMISESCVEFKMTEQMLAEIGKVQAQIHLVDTESTVTTFALIIEVKENRIAESHITSSDDYAALVEALKKLEGYDIVEITNGEIDSLGNSFFDGGEKEC